MVNPDFQIYSGTERASHLASVHISDWSNDQAGVPTGTAAASSRQP